MSPKRTSPATIDQYIAGFPPDIRKILQSIRKVVRKAAPEAEEAISYQISTFKLHGSLVYFAACKAHIGFYPSVKGDARIERAVARYAGEGGISGFRWTNRCRWISSSGLRSCA